MSTIRKLMVAGAGQHAGVAGLAVRTGLRSQRERSLRVRIPSSALKHSRKAGEQTSLPNTYALVAQLAEATVSKTVEYGFESHEEHLMEKQCWRFRCNSAMADKLPCIL